MNTIIWVPTNSLKPSDFNPPSRSYLSRCKELVASMKEHGFDEFRPILVGNDGRIGDGHRRWTVAQHLGIPLVPIMLVDKSSAELFERNRGNRSISSSQWMYASQYGIKNIPPNTARQIETLYELVGDTGIVMLANRGASPSIITYAQRIAKYINATTPIMIARIIYWLVEQRQQDNTRRFMGDFGDPAVLIDAIVNKKKLQRGEWATV
jgi:hypothetical protein